MECENCGHDHHPLMGCNEKHLTPRPEPARSSEGSVTCSDWVGAELELRTESDETVVASCALPISINALCAMEKGLSAQYGAGLYMRQRGKMLEFFKPSRAEKKAPTDPSSATGRGTK